MSELARIDEREVDLLTKQKVFKDGFEIPKGNIITRQWLEANENNIKRFCNIFTSHPDVFLELITPTESQFKLFFYQRLFLRVVMRYRYVYTIAPRAFSKTFICVLALILKAIFQPRSKLFFCAPNKTQSASVFKEKLDEIFNLFPLLRREFKVINQGKDYVTCITQSGSVLDVVGANLLRSLAVM